MRHAALTPDRVHFSAGKKRKNIFEGVDVDMKGKVKEKGKGVPEAAR